VLCVDYFIVFKGVVANFSEFMTVEVCTQLLRCAIEPVLSIPIFGGAVDHFGRNWSVDVFLPQFVVCDFTVNCAEAVVE